MRVVYKDLEYRTEHNNLVQMDGKLKSLVGEEECFYALDLTEDVCQIVMQSDIKNGLFIAQVMHTTCILSLNELNEPMLLGDVYRHFEKTIPKEAHYLHNSSERTANLVKDSPNNDRNADAHLKAFLVGTQTVTLPVREGQLSLGHWQRLTLIDFDGPKQRRLTLQILGE